MEIQLVKTGLGLRPVSDTDANAIKKIEEGEIVILNYVRPRNYKLLKKYMALIQLMWENDSLALTKVRYRKEMEIAAGYFETYIGFDGSIRKDPRSIAFKNMEEDEFKVLFTDMLTIACMRLGVDSGEITNELKERLGKFF